MEAAGWPGEVIREDGGGGPMFGGRVAVRVGGKWSRARGATAAPTRHERCFVHVPSIDWKSNSLCSHIAFGRCGRRSGQQMGSERIKTHTLCVSPNWGLPLISYTLSIVEIVHLGVGGICGRLAYCLSSWFGRCGSWNGRAAQRRGCA